MICITDLVSSHLIGCVINITAHVIPRPKVRLLRVRSRTPSPEPAGDALFSLRYKHPEEYNHNVPETGGIVVAGGTGDTDDR